MFGTALLIVTLRLLSDDRRSRNANAEARPIGADFRREALRAARAAGERDPDVLRLLQPVLLVRSSRKSTEGDEERLQGILCKVRVELGGEV
jgi:hypothetical protein